jgi:hypothetical protein
MLMMTELLMATVGIGIIAIYARPEMAGVLTVAVGMVGTIGAFYFGADGYIKGKGTHNEIKS